MPHSYRRRSRLARVRSWTRYRTNGEIARAVASGLMVLGAVAALVVYLVIK